jgi:2-C-methyl-D-erythritol 4-phosphate cytidylyltransferase
MTHVSYDVGAEYADEPVPALGTVVEEGRGSLPFALLHGEALVACATWALGEAGVTPVDLGTDWSGLVASGEAVVLHDSLCPMTPPAFINACVQRAYDGQVVVVGSRPVTDTVKVLAGDAVGETVDRTGLVTITSPVVLPPAVVAALDGLPSLDFAALVADLRDRFPLELLEAPPAGRRVASEGDVRVLEALTAG